MSIPIIMRAVDPTPYSTKRRIKTPGTVFIVLERYRTRHHIPQKEGLRQVIAAHGSFGLCADPIPYSTKRRDGWRPLEIGSGL